MPKLGEIEDREVRREEENKLILSQSLEENPWDLREVIPIQKFIGWISSKRSNRRAGREPLFSDGLQKLNNLD